VGLVLKSVNEIPLSPLVLAAISSSGEITDNVRIVMPKPMIAPAIAILVPLPIPPAMPLRIGIPMMSNETIFSSRILKDRISFSLRDIRKDAGQCSDERFTRTSEKVGG
jgi:hypothetical protein